MIVQTEKSTKKFPTFAVECASFAKKSLISAVRNGSFRRKNVFFLVEM